jgi:replicative DNA helicase
VNPRDFKDLDAESGALGAVLVSSAAWDEVAALAEADFTDTKHAAVFRALQACGAAKEPQDAATVARRLSRNGGPDLAFLMALENAPGVFNPSGCVRAIRDMSLRREGVRQALALMQACAQLARPATESILEASAALSSAACNGADTILTGYDAMERLRLKMDAIQRGEYSPTIPTGVKVLDYLFGGLQRGTMTILGARPGIGKTALAETIAINRAHAFQDAHGRCGRTGILWLEDPVEALERRLVAYTSSVPVWRIAKESLTGPALDAVGQGMLDGAELTGDAWRIKEASGLTAKAAAATMRQMHARHGVDLVIVDNLTEIELDEDTLRRNGETRATKDAVATIRNVAKDLDVAVLLLLHLTRSGSKDKDQQHQRPTLESGFGTSAIEKMARLMIFLWEDPNMPRHLAGFVPKQNEGAKMLEFWLRLNETAALVHNGGGKVAEGTRGYTEAADAEGVEFIRREEEAA